MTRAGLRVFLDQWFCGCGSPDAAAAALLRLLRLHPLYEHRAELEAWVTDDGIEHLLLYALGRHDLTEHGGSVGGAWLTPKGEAVRDALAAEEGDGFEALFEHHCVHGYDVDDETHTCPAVEPRTVWIVEPVGYDRYSIHGVFETIEGAKASVPPYEWRQDDDGGWVTTEADACSNSGYTLYEEEIGP